MRSTARVQLRAAKITLTLPHSDRTALQTILTGDMARYDQLTADLDLAQAQLDQVLADTPNQINTRT